MNDTFNSALIQTQDDLTPLDALDQACVAAEEEVVRLGYSQ